MFYIFHGEDELSKREYIAAKLLDRYDDRDMLDLNTTRFESNVPLNALRQACQTAPFLSPIRIVIVQDLLGNKPGQSYLKELADFLPALPQTTRLLLLESSQLRDNHALIKLARTSDQGFEKYFPLPQGSGINRWIQQRVNDREVRITPEATQLLAAMTGHDLQLLDNELEKLSVYTLDREDREIGLADVTALSPYVVEESIFDLVDALGNRNEKRASLLYQRKLAEGEEPFKLFAMFVRQFRLLIQVKELTEGGHKPAAVAQALRVPGFVASKLVQQARGFGMGELEQIHRHLLDIDVAVKTGEADMQTSLDLLVANLTLAP